VQCNDYIDLHPNEKAILGHANGTSVNYRHYIIDRNGTFNFTVIPVIGNPALLVKVSDVPVKPKSLDVNTWDFKKDNPEK
jgi:hypothetical protein